MERLVSRIKRYLNFDLKLWFFKVKSSIHKLKFENTKKQKFYILENVIDSFVLSFNREGSVTKRWDRVWTESKREHSQFAICAGFQRVWRVLSFPSKFSEHNSEWHDWVTSKVKKRSKREGRVNSEFWLN